MRGIAAPGRRSPRLGDTIERVYRAIDEEIGQMIALAGADVRTLVVAAHGMGPIYHASWHLTEILDLLGYGRSGVPDRRAEVRAARVNPWRILKMVVPAAWQYRIKAALPTSLQDRLLFLWYSGGEQWAGRRAFSVPNNDSVGGIRLSVRGRDRQGLIAPGDEYRRVCQDIATALSELRDPVSNRLSSAGDLTPEVFHGRCRPAADITVLLWSGLPMVRVRSPRFGTLRVRRQDARTGSHTPRGFFVAVRPGVAAGVERRRPLDLRRGPPVLVAAGVPVPRISMGHAAVTRLGVPA